MDAARWELVQGLFHRALEQPQEERRGWLAQAVDDPGVLDDVVRLLDEDAGRLSVLDEGIGEAAAILVGAASLSPADIFGPYRIVRLLGEGGMGVVYLAERPDVGSRVALKVLRDALPSPARRERFADEQRILARMTHPAIAQLHDAGTLGGGTPWFVMEYVDGVPLTEYCTAHGTSIEGRLELLQAVCEGVRHAHQHAVIHRDLKPSNILVTHEGRVKLLDFGIAKPLDAPERDATRTGWRVMTPAYAAPEQRAGLDVGTHSDVYSLGVILYELLTGRLPDAGQQGDAAAAADPPRPSAIARRGTGGVRPRGGHASWADLDVLCLTAMHQDPTRRYRTVDAFARDIARYLEGEPLEARPDTVAYRIGKFVRRHRAAVAGAAAVAILIAAVSAFYTYRLAQARTAAELEAMRTQRMQQFMLSLFDAGETDAGPAGDLRVVSLIERGVREARALDREPEVQADLYQTLGGLYQRLGRLEDAETLFASALARLGDSRKTEGPEAARALVARGVLRADQARFDEAERLVRDGLAMARRHRPPDHAEVRDAGKSLGHVLIERGRYDEAATVLQEVLAAHHDSADPGYAATLHELANAHFYKGDYERAATLNQQVLALHRRRHGERHPSVAAVLVNLGAIASENGRYVDAERRYREALAIVEAWYGPEHPETAADLTMLARSLVYQARADEAVPLLARALAIRERVFGALHPQVASSLNELGSVAVLQKRDVDAERHFTRMIEIYRHAYGDSHSLIATAQSNLASVYMGRGENARAEALFLEVVRRFTDTVGAEHNYTAIARIKLGRSLLRQRKFAAALGESRAGHDILIRTTEPTSSFIRAARTDIAAAETALAAARKP
jgi:serine/threonine-protein kinase